MITLRARHYRRIANLKLRGQRGTLALTLLIYFAICGIFFLLAYLSAFLPIVPDLVKAANSYYDFHSFFRHEFIDFMFSFLLAYLPYAAGISALLMFFWGGLFIELQENRAFSGARRKNTAGRSVQGLQTLHSFPRPAFSPVHSDFSLVSIADRSGYRHVLLLFDELVYFSRKPRHARQ